MINPEKAGVKIHALVAKFPSGAWVWHRASAKKGIVIGWELRHQGNVFVIVDYGQQQPSAEYPMNLSSEAVPEGGEGEQWKESRP